MLVTTTFYPDANPESSSIDGSITREGVDQTFTNIRSGAGTNVYDTQGTNEARIDASTTSNQFALLARGFLLFDTSTIPDNATLVSAVISLYGNTKVNNLGSPNLHIGSSNPASNTSLAASDFGSIGTTTYASIAYAAFSTSAYNDLTLDATGLATVSKTGVSKFSAQLSWDINNSFDGAWSSAAASLLRWESADGTNKPKLTVTYEIPGGSIAYFM